MTEPMLPEDDGLLLLLDRYLAGEASSAEARAVREWLAADPEHPALLEELREIRAAVSDRPPASDVEAAWAGAAAELGLAASDARVPPARRTPAVERAVARRPRMRWSMRAAAAAIVLGLLGGAWWQLGLPTPGSGAVEWQEYTTAAAFAGKVRLRDGTQVMLGPESRLRFTEDFGVSHRDVHLEGKAYFEVAPDDDRLFRVHARGTIAEDLGTAFVVESYPEAESTEIVVTEGRVALWQPEPGTSREEPGPRPDHALLLAPGDLGRIDASGSATLRRDVDLDYHLAWTRRILRFDATPLDEVVTTLARWYAFEVRLGDPDLASQTLTATFTTEPVYGVVERIALALDLRVVDGGDHVILYPR